MNDEQQARLAQIRARYADLERLLNDSELTWPRDEMLRAVAEMAGAAKTIPWLLAEVERLEAERDDLEEKVNALTTENARMAGQVAALREALAPYTAHRLSLETAEAANQVRATVATDLMDKRQLLAALHSMRGYVRQTVPPMLEALRKARAALAAGGEADHEPIRAASGSDFPDARRRAGMLRPTHRAAPSNRPEGGRQLSRLARYYLPAPLSLMLNGLDLLTCWRWFHRLFAVLHLASVVLHALAVVHHCRHSHPARPQG